MTGEPLHPNLAAIAAEYDDIVRRYHANQLSSSQAAALLANLHARDDHGVIWSLDPASGQWRRRTLQGQWVTDDPPRQGLATLDGYALAGRPDRFTPDSMVESYQVTDDPNARYEGATRRAAKQQALAAAAAQEDRRVGRLVLLVVAGVVGAALLWWFAPGSQEDAPDGDESLEVVELDEIDGFPTAPGETSDGS